MADEIGVGSTEHTILGTAGRTEWGGSILETKTNHDGNVQPYQQPKVGL